MQGKKNVRNSHLKFSVNRLFPLNILFSGYIRVLKRGFIGVHVTVTKPQIIDIIIGLFKGYCDPLDSGVFIKLLASLMD